MPKTKREKMLLAAIKRLKKVKTFRSRNSRHELRKQLKRFADSEGS